MRCSQVPMDNQAPTSCQALLWEKLRSCIFLRSVSLTSGRADADLSQYAGLFYCPRAFLYYTIHHVASMSVELRKLSRLIRSRHLSFHKGFRSHSLTENIGDIQLLHLYFDAPHAHTHVFSFITGKTYPISFSILQSVTKDRLFLYVTQRNWESEEKFPDWGLRFVTFNELIRK